MCSRLLEALGHCPRLAAWPYDEPEELADILVGTGDNAVRRPLASTEVAGRIWAAWAGRSAGNMLGRPVEGWSREQLRSYLELASAYPLTDYIPALDPMPAGCNFNPCWATTTLGRISEVTRDDDIDYTILNLVVLETFGRAFTTDNVGSSWTTYLPYQSVWVASRAAYRNLVNGLRPPQTAIHLNPYREWIGAQIRADMWGYVNAGRPREAATLAYRDAILSHRTNGVFAAIWAAVLIATCFVQPTMREALDIALTYVPHRSRLAESLRLVMTQFDAGSSWEHARDEVERRFGSYSFVHAVSNAAVLAAALLWGEGDFSQTIGLAVQGGWDTDCNGATAGSAFGAMHGPASLPDKWIAPLRNSVRSAVIGFDQIGIDELAARTAAHYTAG